VLVAVLAVLAAVLPSVVSTPPTVVHRVVVVTPAPSPGAPGLTVGGVHCGPGVRQVPWSAYAPMCMPAWHGDNGGATAPGVTATTITLTYRQPPRSTEGELTSLIPPAASGTTQQVIQTMEAEVATFNSTFELYGRRVVLRPYLGRGDVVAELSGTGQAAAAADAAEAVRQHAFADSSGIGATPVYEAALAARQIIGIGPAGLAASGSPYLYSTGPACAKTAEATVRLVEQSLAPTTVSYAGGDLNGRRRVFGLVDARPSASAACTRALTAGLGAIGVRPLTVGPLSLGAPTVTADVRRAVVAMKGAGVTTVLCTTCGPFVPALLTRAAEQIGYSPEWVQSSGLDALGVLQPWSEASHSVALGAPAVALAGTEAEHAFDLSAPAGAKPAPDAADVYAPLVLFFDALQAAGPDLTPSSFGAGLRTLAPSLDGAMFGRWTFGPRAHDPNATYGLVRFSPTVLSPLDQSPGAWVACNGGARYAYAPEEPPQLPRAKPLDCPPAG